MAPVLVPCPHCRCHAKSTEATCPSCGEPIRRSDGSIPRTTVAVLLGLTAGGAFGGACGPSVAVFYGPAQTTSSSSGAGGAGTGGAGTGAGGADTGGAGTASSSGPGVFYGPAMTSSSSSGTGGSGTGGSGTGGKDGG